MSIKTTPKTITLRWKKLNEDTEVAEDGMTTLVLTRNRGAGKRLRYNLTLTHSHLEPVILGRELTRSHCLKLANEVANDKPETVETVERQRKILFVQWWVLTSLARMDVGSDLEKIEQLGLLGTIEDYKRFARGQS